MKLGKDLLLTTEYAKTLYTRFASDISVADYSCRMPFDKLVNNPCVSNVWEIWQNDENVIRVMRACGTEEKYITGNASDYEKFRAFCQCMPSLAGNPVYMLSHMALQAFFGCGSEISLENCDVIWRYTADLIQKQSFTVETLLSRLKIDTLCALADISEFPKVKKAENCSQRVLPTVSFDGLFPANKKEYGKYINKLSEVSGVDINDLSSLGLGIEALLDAWKAVGCKTLRIDLPSDFHFETPDLYHAEKAFHSLTEKGRVSDPALTSGLIAQILRVAFSQICKSDYTVQIYVHGADAREIDALVSYIKNAGFLPRGMLLISDSSANLPEICDLCQKYSVGDGNMPSVLAGIGCKNASDKVIKEAIVSYAGFFAIGKMAGMSVNASSISALLAHDLFKRTLCSLLGEWMEVGRISDDMMRAGVLINDVCAQNAKAFFGL